MQTQQEDASRHPVVGDESEAAGPGEADESQLPLEALTAHLQLLAHDGGTLARDVFKVAQVELAISRMGLGFLLLLGSFALTLCAAIVISGTALVVYLLAQNAALGWATALLLGLLINVLLLTGVFIAARGLKRQIGLTRTRSLLREIFSNASHSSKLSAGEATR